MRTEFLCISVLRVASGPRVKFASCKSALNPAPTAVVYSTDRSKAVLVLLFVALWFILRGDLFYVLPCVIYMSQYTLLSPKLNTSHSPEFKYLDRHSHYLTIIIFSTNPTT